MRTLAHLTLVGMLVGLVSCTKNGDSSDGSDAGNEQVGDLVGAKPNEPKDADKKNKKKKSSADTTDPKDDPPSDQVVHNDPAIEFVEIIPAHTAEPTHLVTLKLSDELRSYTFQVFPGLMDACKAPGDGRPRYLKSQLLEISLATLADGPYTLCVYGFGDDVSDALASAYQTFVRDTLPPVVSLPSTSLTLREPTVFAVSSSEPVSLSWTTEGGPLRLDGDENDRRTVSASSDGLFAFSIRAEDLAGNTSSVEVDVNWDATAPTILNSDLTLNQYSIFEILTDDEDAQVQVVAPAELQVETLELKNSFRFAGTDGYYQVTLQARDSYGNEAAKTIQIRMDSTKPAIIATVYTSYGYDLIKSSLSVVMPVSASNHVSASWEQVAGLPVTFSDTARADTTISVPEKGAYEVKLTVVDGDGDEVSRNFRIWVDDSKPSIVVRDYQNNQPLGAISPESVGIGVRLVADRVVFLPRLGSSGGQPYFTVKVNGVAVGVDVYREPRVPIENPGSIDSLYTPETYLVSFRDMLPYSEPLTLEFAGVQSYIGSLMDPLMIQTTIQNGRRANALPAIALPSPCIASAVFSAIGVTVSPDGNHVLVAFRCRKWEGGYTAAHHMVAMLQENQWHTIEDPLVSGHTRFDWRYDEVAGDFVQYGYEQSSDIAYRRYAKFVNNTLTLTSPETIHEYGSSSTMREIVDVGDYVVLRRSGDLLRPPFEYSVFNKVTSQIATMTFNGGTHRNFCETKIDGGGIRASCFSTSPAVLGDHYFVDLSSTEFPESIALNNAGIGITGEGHLLHAIGTVDNEQNKLHVQVLDQFESEENRMLVEMAEYYLLWDYKDYAFSHFNLKSSVRDFVITSDVSNLHQVSLARIGSQYILYRSQVLFPNVLMLAPDHDASYPWQGVLSSVIGYADDEYHALNIFRGVTKLPLRGVCEVNAAGIFGCTNSNGDDKTIEVTLWQ